MTKGTPLVAREFHGTLKDWVIGMPVIFGTPLFGLYALAAFPLLDGNDPTLLYVSVAGFAATFAPLVIWRKEVFPWGDHLPFLLWGGLLAFAACGAMAITGAFLCLNGALDRHEPRSIEFTVLRKSSYKGDHTLFLTAEPGLSASRPTLDISRHEYLATAIGSRVIVDVKPGFFGRPWVAGYRPSVNSQRE